MLGFIIARWKGVVAALASSKKLLLRCLILTHSRFAKRQQISSDAHLAEVADDDVAEGGAGP